MDWKSFGRRKRPSPQDTEAPAAIVAQASGKPRKKHARGARVDFDYLRPDEVEALLSAAHGPWESAILSCFYYLGIRCNELRMLNVEDVDFTEGVVRVLHAKGGKQRLLPLDDEGLAPVLRAWLAIRPDVRDENGRALFPTTKTRRVSNRYLRFVVKAIGVRADVGHRSPTGVHPHMLRHTTATTLLSRDVDIRVVQEVLGHSQLSTTALYAAVSTDLKRRAMQRLSLRPKESA